MIDTASAILGTVEAKEANTTSYTGPDPVSITLRINGETRMLQVEPRMTLAQALRGPLACPCVWANSEALSPGPKNALNHGRSG